MKYTDVDDGQLINMLHEASEDAKDLLFEKYKYIIDIEMKKEVVFMQTITQNLTGVTLPSWICKQCHKVVTEYNNNKEIEY